MLLLETTPSSTASSPPAASAVSSSPATPTSTSIVSTLGLTMLTSGANQYIQPDYLSPLPTTLDAKRSPLALLAQTCSQIGADPAPVATTSTSLLTPAPSAVSLSKPADKSSANKKDSAEKPSGNRKTPPVSKDHKSGFKSPGSKTSTASPSMTSTSAFTAADTKLSEAQRAALDALTAQQQQLAKDMSPLSASLGAYRPPAMFPTLPSLPGLHPAAYGLPGLDPATAAALGAFRHPAYPSPMAYPPTSLGLSLAYQQALSSYGRLAHPMPGKSDQVCRDPYCTGCPSSLPTSTPSTTSPSAGSCPAGCNQCDHPKTPAAPTSTSTPTAITSSASSTTSTASVSPNLASSRPYVCNWIAGDQYCGKRFTSSEELLQHLRTHTSLTVPPTPSVESSYSSLLNPSLAHSHLLASSGLHRTYPTPPLSPLSMARYHPYSKPATASPLTTAAPSAAPAPPSPMLSLHNPYAAAAASLGAYYSHPYSLYSQRMLAGAGVLP